MSEAIAPPEALAIMQPVVSEAITCDCADGAIMQGNASVSEAIMAVCAGKDRACEC